MEPLLFQNQQFHFNTLPNAPTYGKSTKDGEIRLLYSSGYSLPQLVRKKFYKSHKYLKELTVLKLVSSSGNFSLYLLIFCCI